MEQSLTIIGRNGVPAEASWRVDLPAAGKVQKWAREQPGLLEDEVRDMASYFPRWVLALAEGNELSRCAACGELVVMRDGATRCVACGVEKHGQQLAWVGHLPMPVGGLPRALGRIRSKPHPAYPLVEVGGMLLWLVPVMAFYPDGWPRQQPVLRYQPELFSILGISSPNATHHIVGGNIMCLYGGGPWRVVTMREVLQQRVVNHLASMIKVGDGQRPVEAFAGRQHVYDNSYYDR